MLPNRLRSQILRRLFKWNVHPTARIGLSLLSVDYVEMAAYASIGHFNTIRNVNRLALGRHSVIGQWMWISASSLLVDHNDTERGVLIIGDHSAVTSRHYLDVSGGVTIGDFTTLAGVRSTILTHQIDVQSNCQILASVKVGNRCLIGSNTKIVPGSTISARILVGMGSVVTNTLDQEGWLYAGVPAKPIKHVGDGRYFEREIGFVGPSTPTVSH
jgi:acetyltransferase-like isoleucine patch superfamily enzyme